MDEVMKELKMLKNEINELKIMQRNPDFFKAQEEKMSDIQVSMQHMNSIFEELRSSNALILQKITMIETKQTTLEKKNENLERELNGEKKERKEVEEELQKQINQLEIERRSRKLELQGVEEKEGENCVQTVASIIDKVTPDVKIEDVVSAFRIGNKTNRNGSTKPRTILFELKNKTIRDKVYYNKKNLKKINVNNSRFFINENLPFNLKHLLFKTNQARNEKSYKFMWTKNGTILVRKNESSDAIPIYTASDLEKIV